MWAPEGILSGGNEQTVLLKYRFSRTSKLSFSSKYIQYNTRERCGVGRNSFGGNEQTVLLKYLRRHEDRSKMLKHSDRC